MKSQVSRVTGGEASGKLVEMAQQLVMQLGEYKGLMMKIGQVASYMDFTLPEEARAVLAKLQDSVPPMTPKEIKMVFVRAFKKPPEEIFAEWEEQPFAAASIGQVHRARLKTGEEVAVKIQYPDIQTALKNDFRAVPMIVGALKPLFRGMDFEPVVKEVRRQLMNECDYRKEASSQMKFRALYQNHPGVCVPEVFDDYSAKRVLTTRFIDAKRFNDFASEASEEERNRAGQIIAEVFLRSTLSHGFFNGDPHPGNYLFLSDQVCFLDFGHTVTWSKGKCEKLQNLWRATLNEDQADWRKAFLSLYQPRDPEYDESWFFRFFVDQALHPYLQEDFTFTREFVEEYSKKVMLKTPWKALMVTPDKDIVIWERQIAGVNAVLSLLQARGNFRAILENVLTAE
jgi:predicted unusual protein kinase regulating ubiquinone biosynthesis (AarF/ABC1/UbiB family)